MHTRFQADPSYEPWNNANPTYTMRDNVTKIIGKHTLQFGALRHHRSEKSGEFSAD